MFSICAFLRKFLHGLWSFSLKCARRLSQTRTLPKDFLQKLRPATESPGSLDDATQEWHHVSALWEVHGHSQTARRGRKALATSRCKQRQVREHLNLSWNVWNKDAGPLPVRTRNCRSWTDVLAKIPVSMESAELAIGLALLYVSHGFQNTRGLCSQCARLCINFWSL